MLRPSTCTRTSPPSSEIASTRAPSRRSAPCARARRWCAALARAAAAMPVRSWNSTSVASSTRNSGNAPHRLRAVEPLVGHATGVHRAAVGLAVEGILGREDVDTAGLDHELGARLGRDLAPGGIRRLRQPHVRRVVVGEADDPRVVLRGAAVVPELEALEPDHARAAAREPVRRRAADATEPEHDDIRLVLRHHRSLPSSSFARYPTDFHRAPGGFSSAAEWRLI